MTKFEYILAIDPSGNYLEGRGITGFVLIDKNENIIEAGTINSKHYERSEEYWNEHLNLIDHFKRDNMIVVIEDYLLYYNRAKSQTNSKMETCRLIGLLQWYCWENEIPYSLQRAVDVKHRWSDELLQNEGILDKYMNDTKSGQSLKTLHVRDAFRHAMHYVRCKNMKRKTITNYTKGVNGNVRSNYEG